MASEATSVAAPAATRCARLATIARIKMATNAVMNVAMPPVSCIRRARFSPLIPIKRAGGTVISAVGITTMPITVISATNWRR
jgi:hypothetical protein